MLTVETRPTAAQRLRPSFNQTVDALSTPDDDSIDPATFPSQARIFVVHGNPIIAAGLGSLIRDNTEWNVVDLDARSWTPGDGIAGKHVVLVDEDTLVRATRSSSTSAAGRSAWSRLVLVCRETIPDLRARALAVDATISANCSSRNLLDVVGKLVAQLHRTANADDVRSTMHASAASHDAARPRRFKGGLAPHALRRVQDYIAANYAEAIDVHQLAAIAKLSSHHFARAFKQSLGVPPHRYVLLRRVREAADLVRDTERSFAEIGATVGFADQSHFSRAFVTLTGERPSAFRRMHR